MRLFVSFAHVDAVRVAALAKTLAAAGFEPWWDNHLAPGEDWKAELMRQIAACDAFLYVASPDSAESEWCRWELAQATALSKFIMPVIVRPGTALPRVVSNLQYVDASAGLDDDEIGRLVDRLARLRQTGVLDATFRSASLRGFPARFTRPLPKTYRTVAQGFLRPAAPNMYGYEFPQVDINWSGKKKAPIIGIDFGTTTSVVAVHNGDRIALVTNDLGETSTPSAVAIAEDGTALVGRRASELLIRRPERGVLEVKRLFGREMTREMGGPPVLEIDGVSYSPVDLAALVLSKLRTDAEAFVGAPVWKAVLAAPASFDQSQLVQLMSAARLAGLEVMRVLSEPVAACMGVSNASREGYWRTLVYDLGGGTFDVSIVECSEGVFEVKAVNGDTHLGGADFDREVVDYCLNEFAQATGVELRGNATALMRLRDEVERAKIELSTARATTVSVPFVAFGQSGRIDLNVELTRTVYNGLTHGLVARTIALTRAAIDDAGETVATLDDVVVVGCAARAPSVRVALQDLFGDVRSAPDHVVAVGAAAEAAVLDGAIKDRLLLDTLTNTLRVQLPGGQTVPVIVRHSTIPTRSQLTLTTQYPKQRIVLLRILAGESSWANRNLALIEAQVPCDSPNEGHAELTLVFDVDANSYLSVGTLDESRSRDMKVAIGLRGTMRNEQEPTEPADLTADREALLPSYRDDRRLRPLREALLTNLPSVRWWLADAAMSCVLSADRRSPEHRHSEDVKRARKIRKWLEANPDQDLPVDIANWNPFQNFTIEREFLVDLLERRLGIELASLRRCRSIATMSERLVTRVREARL